MHFQFGAVLSCKRQTATLTEKHSLFQCFVGCSHAPHNPGFLEGFAFFGDESTWDRLTETSGGIVTCEGFGVGL